MKRRDFLGVAAVAPLIGITTQEVCRAENRNLPVLEYGPPTHQGCTSCRSLANAEKIFQHLEWREDKGGFSQRVKSTLAWVDEKDPVEYYTEDEAHRGMCGMYCKYVIWGKVKVVLNACGAIYLYHTNETHFQSPYAIISISTSCFYNPELAIETENLYDPYDWGYCR
jgi:hypothetical protein